MSIPYFLETFPKNLDHKIWHGMIGEMITDSCLKFPVATAAKMQIMPICR